MPYIALQGWAQDWDQWQRVLAETRAQRQSMGIKSEQVFRSIEDPTAGIVLFEFDDVEQGREVLLSSQAQQSRQRAGVRGVRIYVPAEGLR